MFTANFDVSTTVDPTLKKRVASWPLIRHWLRVLHIPTLFVGTTVSEYMLSTQSQAPAQWLPQALHAWGRRFRLIIVKDIPCTSPLLGAADNAHAHALAEACVKSGCVMVQGQALAYVPMDFPDIASYLRRLSPARRKNLQRKLRSRAQLEIRCLPTGSDCFLDEATLSAYYALYEAVFSQSDMHFDHLSPQFFAALLQDGQCGGVVFEYRSAGRLIGWNLCFESGGKLLDKYIGFLYPDARTHNLYFVSWFVNLEYAMQRGLSHYVAGWTDPAVKAQLGASFTFTQHAVYVRNPALRWLARRFSGHFERDRIWHEANA